MPSVSALVMEESGTVSSPALVPSKGLEDQQADCAYAGLPVKLISPQTPLFSLTLKNPLCTKCGPWTSSSITRGSGLKMQNCMGPTQTPDPNQDSAFEKDPQVIHRHRNLGSSTVDLSKSITCSTDPPPQVPCYTSAEQFLFF